jgi:hypothetical protein
MYAFRAITNEVDILVYNLDVSSMFLFCSTLQESNRNKIMDRTIHNPK